MVRALHWTLPFFSHCVLSKQPIFLSREEISISGPISGKQWKSGLYESPDFSTIITIGTYCLKKYSKYLRNRLLLVLRCVIFGSTMMGTYPCKDEILKLKDEMGIAFFMQLMKSLRKAAYLH